MRSPLPIVILSMILSLSVISFAHSEAGECEPVTGDECVDTTCCVVDNVYENPYGLVDHALYVTCVADAAEQCSLDESSRGDTIDVAVDSSVNQ
jgi:hypothetical protein